MPKRRKKQSETRVPTMTAPESIAVAINQIDEKKENLKKAFDDLQAHRSLLSPSFNLSWSEIDSHFSSLKSSLSNRFRLLQSATTPPSPDKIEPSTPPPPPPLLWPELRTFCENMDGKGLGEYMVDNSKKRFSINLELPQAIRCSSNPAALVLDAIEGSYHCSPSSSARAIDARRVFVLLLEALLEINPKLTNDLRERAKTLACDWQKNIGNKPSEALGFLFLVVVFELGSVFKIEEVLDYVFLISKYKQTTTICKKLGLGNNRIAGLIQKLLHTGRFLAAISFSYEFEMTDRFRPVVILKTSLKNAREAAKRVCAEGNNSLKAQIEATDKELSALRAVIKVVKEKNLEVEFYEEKLEECVQELENQKAQRRLATQQQQVDNKRPRVVPTEHNLTIPAHSQQQPRLPDPRLSFQSQQQPRLPDPRQSLQSQRQPLLPDPRHSLQSQRQPLLPDPRHSLQSQRQPLLPDRRHNSLQVNPFGLLSSAMPGVAVPYGNPLAMYGAVPPPALPSQPVYYGQQTGYGGYGLPPQHHQPYYHH